MGVLTSYMLAHAEERKHAQARIHKLFTLQGTGIRDLEYKASQSEYLNKQGYLLRQVHSLRSASLQDARHPCGEQVVPSKWVSVPPGGYLRMPKYAVMSYCERCSRASCL